MIRGSYGKKTEKLFQAVQIHFLLSAFTFGGGYVIIPLMKKRFCGRRGWLEERKG
jgi:chromate transporter